MALPSVREEIIELSHALALAQSRLLQLAKRVERQDQDTEIWKNPYTDLDVALASGKWLTVRNAELERKLANHKPEVNNVLSAREGAFQKLKHAREVIRDLEERDDMKSPRTSIRQEDIDQALYEEFHRGEDSPSNDSNKTVRLVTAPQISTSPSASQLSQESQESTSRRNAPEDFLPVDVESEHSVASPLSQASQISPQTSEELEPPKTSGGLWRRIRFKKPPGTSVLIDGPLSS